MIDDKILKRREAECSQMFRIVPVYTGITDTFEGFAVQRKESYISDSLVAAGSDEHFWNTEKEYKTMRAAKQRLKKVISCYFPKGYDVSEVLKEVHIRGFYVKDNGVCVHV